MQIVLAEPLGLLRAGLRRLIEETGQGKVVGEAADGQSLLELIARLRPPLVLAELRLPGIGGLELLSQIRRHYPEVRVLILSASTEPGLVRAVLQSGAAGYLSKDAEPAELAIALNAMSKQQTYLSPVVSGGALERRRQPRGEQAAILTPRQRQVLQLVARGKSTKEIAGLMGLSVKTVETHRMRLMQTLNLRGTQALMHYALRAGMDGH